MPPLNATSVHSAPSRFSPANEVIEQTYLSSNLLRAGNIPHPMGNLSAVSAAVSSASNSGIASPVLVSQMGSSFLPAFHDQDELNREWSLLQEQLKTRTLRHRQAWEVLSSGILRTDTGKFLCGLFTDAMVRSFPRFASLDEGQLKYLFDVLCGLPPEQWQAALGEDFRLTSAHNNGLASGIQSQLDTSCAEREGRIESGELLANAPWETLKALTQEGRRYIPEGDYVLHGDGTLDEALMMLEDAAQDRLSPKAVYADLDKFVRLLEQRDVTQVRLPERYVTEVKALRDLVKPDDEAQPSWLEWVFGPGWLEQLRTYPLWSAAPDDSTPQPNDDPRWPLSSFQRFERNASFKLEVSTTGPRIPESFAGKLLWACNALDTFGQLRLDSSHISPYARATPSNHAWKNGASDFSESPFEPAPEQSPTVDQTDPLASVIQLMATVDEWFTRNMVPWDSATALPEGPGDVAIEMESLGRFVPEVEVVREQVMGWAARLIGSGAAVWNGAGALVEANPGRFAGLLGVCVLVNNILDYLSQSDPEEMVDPLRGINPDPDELLNIELLTHEYTIEGVLDLLEDFPTFAEEVRARIKNSVYVDPVNDPQLIKDLGIQLQKPVPGIQNLTYRDYMHEISRLAGGDAHASVIWGTDASLLNCADLLIESVQRNSDAKIKLRPGEKIAPNMTIETGAKKFVAAFVAAQKIYQPQDFMRDVVYRTISESDLPENIKSTLTPETKFRVHFVTPGKASALIGVTPEESRVQEFTLLQLFAGSHSRFAERDEIIKIKWPLSYTVGFKKDVAEVNFEDLYKENIKNIDSQSDAVELWKIAKKQELTEILNTYLCTSNSSISGQRIAKEYLKGNAMAWTMSTRNHGLSSPDVVSSAVYLTFGDGAPGIFVFLGEGGKVIECPPKLFVRGGSSIEEFPELSLELSKRIPIKAFISRGEDDFKYSQGKLTYQRDKPGWTDGFNLIGWLLGGVKSKHSYWPIIFNHEFRSGDDDLFETLHKRQTDKVLADLDTMTTTRGEVITDQVIELFSTTFKNLALIVKQVPHPGAKLLMGLSLLVSAGLTYARGVNSDEPEKTAKHNASVVRSAVFAFIAPFISKIVNGEISHEAGRRLGAMAIQIFKNVGHVSPEVAKYLPTFGEVPSESGRGARKALEWIPSVKLSKSERNRLLQSNHRNPLVVTKLERLQKGPHVAQKLMSITGTFFFAGPDKGYVYKGFVMRGDMRSPDIVFKEGFQLRTPIKDIKQVNGMSAGFSGGENSLNPDGTGISTSVFYNDNGEETSRSGDQGGYTYLIDARRLEGFDLYRNQNFAGQPPSEQGFKPGVINYGTNINGSYVLGAYDSKGVFFPNPNAIRKSIAASSPKPIEPAAPANLAVNNGSHHSQHI